METANFVIGIIVALFTVIGVFIAIKSKNKKKSIHNNNVHKNEFNNNGNVFYTENGNINNKIENKQENLPLMADELLIAAVTGDFPEIKVYENLMGGQYEINANGKIWSSSESIKKIEYSDVIKKLISIGYIEFIRKNTYEVTKNGADYAKNKINST